MNSEQQAKPLLNTPAVFGQTEVDMCVLSSLLRTSEEKLKVGKHCSSHNIQLNILNMKFILDQQFDQIMFSQNLLMNSILQF